MNCQFCNTQLNQPSNFCPACGENLHGDYTGQISAVIKKYRILLIVMTAIIFAEFILMIFIGIFDIIFQLHYTYTKWLNYFRSTVWGIIPFVFVLFSNRNHPGRNLLVIISAVFALLSIIGFAYFLFQKSE